MSEVEREWGMGFRRERQPNGSGEWLGLVIGNSRLHWGRFRGDGLQRSWNTPHFRETATAEDFQELLSELPADCESVWLASVVPAQAALWQAIFPEPGRVRLIQLSDIAIDGLYPTMGIDRALTLWGAIATLGSPTLVIDAGTALTFTAANDQNQLMGGAILPGVGLQLRSLAEHTAALPALSSPAGEGLPLRWATSTPEAIRSGVLYTIAAGIQSFIADWLVRYPNSSIALTGGDGALLLPILLEMNQKLGDRITVDPNLMFRAMPLLANKAQN